MAEDVKAEGQQEAGEATAKPWGDRTPEQLWNEYQQADQAARRYREAVGEVDPDQLRQGWEWAKQAYQAVQSGRLRYAEAEQEKPKVVPSEQTDQFGLPANYDEMSPREQALLLLKQQQEFSRAELGRLVAAEAAKANELINNYTSRTDQEKALLFQVLEASRGNPKLDIKAALQNAVQLKSATPDKLLEMAIASASAPDPTKELDERVAKLVAQKLQEKENERMEAAFGVRGVQRKISLKKNKSSREDVNRTIMNKWRDAGYGV